MSDRLSAGRQASLDAFEHEVRLMLTRRAADVGTGPDTTLLAPTVLADLADVCPQLRSGRQWRQAVPMAAAVVVLAGFGAAFVAQSRSATTEADAPSTGTSAPNATPTSATVGSGTSPTGTVGASPPPTGFSQSCGDTPPVQIDVGSQLGPLQDGPAPQASVEPLVNQMVWHHPGPVNAIEIRWPADPERLASMAPDGLPPGEARGQGPLTGAEAGARPGLSAGFVLGTVGPNDPARTTDPCSVVELAIYGEPAAVEWWLTALQGEWSFGLPLTVADLDPAVGPDGSGGGRPTADKLVIGSERSARRPQVPDGACDGRPGAPAHQGTGDGTASATAAAAFEAFVKATAATTDPPLPTTGYTEVLIDDDTISYIVNGDRSPIVVVDLSRTSAGWTVDHWSASPC